MTEPVVPTLAPVFRVAATVGPVEDLGVTSAGHRRIVAILGGTVTGERFSGTVQPGGADWQVLRPDGTVEIDTRYTVRTAGGGLVHLRTQGLRTGRPEVLEAILAGAQVDPSEYYFRLAVRVETADPALAWLQRVLLVASAVRTSTDVVYDAYELT